MSNPYCPPPAQETQKLDTRPLTWASVGTPPVKRYVTIASGQDLTYPDPEVPVIRLLVMDPATGEYLEMSSITDTTGLSRPAAITECNVDATGGAVPDTLVYITTEFDENRLELDPVLTDGLDTIITGVPTGQTVRDALRSLRIIAANGQNRTRGVQ